MRSTEDWSSSEERIRRRLSGIVAVFTALLWVDNFTEHYRGAFERKLMVVPVVAAPLSAAVGLAAGASRRLLWRRVFLVASLAQIGVAIVGAVEHARGIRRRPGRGLQAALYNAWYGPPGAAPLQYLGFGVLGLLATLSRPVLAPVLDVLSLRRLLRLFTVVNIPPLWGEIAYLHARGAFQDPVQWAPVVTLPLAGVASAVATVSDAPAATRAHVAAARTVAALGVIGTTFHFVGMARRYHGLDKRTVLFNWLSGPPVPAPLQLIGLGLVALAAEERKGRG